MHFAGEIMSVFPCRISLRPNIRFRLYCEPADRPSKAGSRFVGFYADKSVGHLACIRTVVGGNVLTRAPASYDFEVCSTERGVLSQDEKERIKGAIGELAWRFDASFLRVRQRFYLLDQVHKTSFIKSSKYGLWRRRDFDLSRCPKLAGKPNYSAAEAASALTGASRGVLPDSSMGSGGNA